MSSRLPVASGFYNYSRLAKSSSNYAKRMNQLSGQIFTEVTRRTDNETSKIPQRFSSKPIDLDRGIVHYYDYIRHPETDELIQALRNYGLFRDEHQDFNEEMERLRELRGKGRKRFFDRHADKRKKSK
ncbi:Ribosomal protein S27/S33 mitochondrial [Trinorchestia longiramus]|nr:Ribosomal protein S27/S33 mitochondrial [Trinorchestia longiramus]